MTADDVRMIRNTILQRTDIAMITDFPILPWDRDCINGLRAQLRDITTQPGFPDNVEWPVFPDWAITRFGLEDIDEIKGS